MALVLRGLQWAFLLIYLDNVIIIGKTFHDLLNNLGEVLSRCRQFGLKLKPTKCNLFKKEVLFLGHVVGKYRIHVNPSLVQGCRDVANLTKFERASGIPWANKLLPKICEGFC